METQNARGGNLPWAFPLCDTRRTPRIAKPRSPQCQTHRPCSVRSLGLARHASRLLAPSVDHQVVERQPRVPEHHPRAGVAHHRPDLLAANRLVAVHRAFGAGGLVLLERALLQPRTGVGEQLGTVGAQRRRSGVPCWSRQYMPIIASSVRASRVMRGWVLVSSIRITESLLRSMLPAAGGRKLTGFYLHRHLLQRLYRFW